LRDYATKCLVILSLNPLALKFVNANTSIMAPTVFKVTDIVSGISHISLCYKYPFFELYLLFVSVTEGGKEVG